jgi:hypothetical protein
MFVQQGTSSTIVNLSDSLTSGIKCFDARGLVSIDLAYPGKSETTTIMITTIMPSSIFHISWIILNVMPATAVIASLPKLVNPIMSLTNLALCRL